MSKATSEIPTSPAAGASPTRERLLETARELFHAQGFTPTGLAQILSQAGVGSGSLYHFFRSKEDLLLAILERYKDMLWPVLLEPIVERVEDPVERVFALLDRYRGLLVESGYRYGCPIGNLALELDEFHPDAVSRVEENFSGWRDAVAGWLELAGERFPPATNFDRLAIFILTTMEGGVMQSRTRRSVGPFDESVAALREYLNLLTEKAEKGNQ